VEFLDVLFREQGCKNIIDIGCGTGNYSTRLSRLKCKVTGVDVSSSMLKIAKEKDKERTTLV